MAISDAAINFLATATNGDLRSSLNALELAVKSTPKNDQGKIEVNQAIVEECLQRKALNSDKDGDAHYDVISAFQKSIRARIQTPPYIMPDGLLNLAIWSQSCAACW